MGSAEHIWWDRVSAADHGVLGTVHPDRGVDLVPVVYVVTGARRVVLPIDSVKAKRTTRLQREVNIELDPRCSLLVENYDDDWTRLWWVILRGRAEIMAPSAIERFRPRFEAKYPRYRTPGSIVGLIGVDVEQISGWSAAGDGERPV